MPLTCCTQIDPILNPRLVLVYKNNDDVVALSGIGIRLRGDPGGTYIAPSSSSFRWDDPDYDRPNDAPRVECHPYNMGHRLFVFHAACWQLFHDSAPSTSCTRPDRLFEILSSLPVKDTVLTWGHDYGGILDTYNDARYPWEAPTIDHLEYTLRWFFPCAPPDMPSGLVVEKQWESQLSTMKETRASLNIVASAHQDCLFRLPEELILSISQLLSTTDFLNARSASKAFWSLFDNRSFWASRFWIGAERAWVFEVRKAAKDSSVNPQTLYRASSEGRLGLRHKNRRRICDLVAAIHPLVELGWTQPSSTHIVLSKPSKLEPLIWHDANSDINIPVKAGHMQDIPQMFAHGSRVFREAMCKLPSHAVSFILYFCVVGKTRYLSGMRIAPIVETNQTPASFGYLSKDHTEYRMPLGSQLTGFTLAMGSGGILGIQFHSIGSIGRVKKQQHVSNWYGNPHDCLTTLRAMSTTKVSAIKAEFDVGFDPYSY